ncbi:putative reverse transcriptase, RNA-dependent DNA polymerase [Tanacetum coccineum]|uniref:Reverse transcriptase, RNA-dependent DNA polymerase n=1 Tax=Tanacetum coccineum TaxID=301880 RepID=A0ABQ4ZDV1_9ASTR
MNKKYCLVATDDYIRFTWFFFLASKDETSGILKSIITKIENLVDKKVKIIRYDNGTKFKNRVMNDFCEKKGIKREFSIARTPQKNSVAERRNKTLIEAARTMLANSKLPTTFWAEVVNSACYVQNRFDGNPDEGFFVGYSLNSDGPKWLFDIDVLTKSMNYVPVVAGTNSNDFVGTKESNGAGHSSKEPGSSQDYILMPLWKDGSLFDSSSKDASNDEPQPSNDAEKKDDEGGIDDQERTENSAQDVNTAGPSINTASTNFNTGSLNINTVSRTVPTAPLESIYVNFFGESELYLSNIATIYPVPSTLNTRYDKMNKGRAQEGNPSIKRSKLDRSYARRASAIQIATSLDIGGFTLWQEARLVTQGYTQEEGIDYDKVFAPVARIEAIRLFLSYASFKDFVVYQMDIKSEFLYGKIEKEVYVYQPLGFEDPEFPDKVYKVEKALYGLHQEPKAWPSSDTLRDVRILLLGNVCGMDNLEEVWDSPFGLGKLLYDSGLCLGCSLEWNPQQGIQNQMLDYGYNFMNTKIFIGNESTICIIKNPVFHSKTKHIEIRHHFIMDSNEKKHIHMIKIHTDHKVADLLLKAFDVGRFQYLIAIDGKEFTVTESSVRRHLQLAVVDVERVTTTAASLDAEKASGAKKPWGVPLIRLGSERVPTLPVILPSQELTPLEVRKLKKTVKTIHSRRRAKIVVSDDEEASEDSFKQERMIEEIDQDAGITLMQLKPRIVHTYTKKRRAFSTGSGGISTASRLFSTAEESISTAGESMPVSTAGKVQEDEQTKRTKLQQEQERLGHEVAVRLQEELDEEERQRMARVHEAAQSFTEEEWENIRARVEANEELSWRLQAKGKEKEKDKKERKENKEKKFQRRKRLKETEYIREKKKKKRNQ